MNINHAFVHYVSIFAFVNLFVVDDIVRRVNHYRGLVDVKAIFENKMNSSLRNGQDYLESLSVVNEMTKTLKELKNIKEENKIDLKEIKERLNQMRKDEEYIQSFSAHTKVFGCFNVDVSLLKEELTRIVEQIYPNIINCLSKIYKTTLINTRTELENIKKELDDNNEDIISYGNILNTLKKFAEGQSNNISTTLEFAQNIYNAFFAKQNSAEIYEILSQAKQKYE